jgi:hypothetical protein
MILAASSELEANMATNNPDFDIETTVDLDNVDEAAAKKFLEQHAVKDDKDNIIEVEAVPDPGVDAKDANAKPLPKDENPEPTEEELAAYSESVRKRIEKLTHARHDERREKEQAVRERDEAIAFAQRALQERKRLEEQAKKYAEESTTSSIKQLDTEISAAEREYIEATDKYDSEAMAAAQKKLASLVVRRELAEAKKSATPIAPTDRPVVQPTPTARPAPDTRAQEWAARNSAWFQKDKAMTAFVFGVHEDLVSKGVDPRLEPDTYYSKLDAEIKARFPEKFERDRTENAPRQKSPVAPASRAVNGRRRVTLTASELAIAKKFRLTPEQFAAEKIKLENGNG